MTTTIALVFTTMIAHAGPVPMCSAELEYIDGTQQTAVLECDSPYAGKCLKQVEIKHGKLVWQEVQCK